MMDYHAEFEKLRDEDYLKFNARLVKSRYPMIGVRVPDIKRLARAAAADAGFCLDEPRTYEEVLLKGLVIAARPQFEESFAAFLPYIDNWAVCDTVVGALKINDADKPRVLARFRGLGGGGEFERRVLAVLLLKYLDADNIDEALKILGGIKSGYYYADMAVAWTVATAAAKFFDKTLTALQDGEWSEFVFNKALRKARESYRLTPAQKERLTGLKRAKKSTGNDKPTPQAQKRLKNLKETEEFKRRYFAYYDDVKISVKEDW